MFLADFAVSGGSRFGTPRITGSMAYSNFWQIFWQNGFLMTSLLEGESENSRVFIGDERPET